MKVFVVDDYNEGITHAYDSIDKARAHCMELLTEVAKYDIQNMESYPDHYDKEDILCSYKQTIEGLKTLATELRVEDICYIYSLNLE